jgi:hypothetical protein
MTRGNELGALFTDDRCHPPEQGMVHYGPGTDRSAATSPPMPSAPTTRTKWSAAPTASS